MESTRIVLVAMPQMLRDIVAGVLADEPDMEIVGEATGVNGLPDAVLEPGADVVVMGRDDPSLATSLLEQQPGMRVLAVAASGRESWLYELRPHRVPLGEISPKRLVEQIRKRDDHGIRGAAP